MIEDVKSTGLEDRNVLIPNLYCTLESGEFLELSKPRSYLIIIKVEDVRTGNYVSVFFLVFSREYNKISHYKKFGKHCSSYSSTFVILNNWEKSFNVIRPSFIIYKMRMCLIVLEILATNTFSFPKAAYFILVEHGL